MQCHKLWFKSCYCLSITTTKKYINEKWTQEILTAQSSRVSSLPLFISRSTDTYTDCFSNPAFLKTISLQMKQKNGLSISKLSIIANKGIQTKASFCKQTRLKSKTKYLAFHTCLNNHLRIKHGHRKNLTGKACDLPCSPPEKVNNPLTNPVGTWFPHM